MKIVHIAPNAPFNDGWGYQENLLPKYQMKLGNEVVLIITNTAHQDGKIINVEPRESLSVDGFKVIRRRTVPDRRFPLAGIFGKLELGTLLEEQKPDLIFYHGLISRTIIDVIRYKKSNPKCVIVEDNHLDYNIGNKINTIKDKLIRGWLRHLNKKSIKYVDRVYGVTPWRKQYAREYFGIPDNKLDVLIMGADDEKCRIEKKDVIRKTIRQKYSIGDDFLIVTGGKIEKNKNIHILMNAVKNLDNIKLLVFGNVSEDLREEFDSILTDAKNIVYVGWIKGDEVYNYFFAADLVFFPGQHSVLWEQACASKVPCVFQQWQGMDHVNNGGNSDFIESVTEDSIRSKINDLHFTDKYFAMKKVAESDNTDVYLYSSIAKKSVECVGKDTIHVI